MELELSDLEQAMLKQTAEWTDTEKSEVYKQLSNSQQSLESLHAQLAQKVALQEVVDDEPDLKNVEVEKEDDEEQ